VEAVKVENLEKSYGKFTVLKEISFSLNFGEVLAVLGPNASGKTTLIKCILGHVLPDGGKVYVKGLDTSLGEKYRNYIGYMPQEPDFPENLTPKDLLNLISSIREREAIYAEKIVEIFKLSPYLNRKIKNFSGGTKQKVNALLAFAFDPEVLILDEPTVGLDPLSNIRFKELIKEEKRKNNAILLTSHIISEVEELADRVIFLLEGAVKISGSVEDLKEKTGETKLERAILKFLEK